MERKDAIFVLLVLGGAGYAAYANWDTISDKLGLHELDPGLVKAIELTKKAHTFETGMSNWQHLQTREKLEEIEIAPDPWTAEHVADWEYRVTVRWTERGEAVARVFSANTKTRVVRHEAEEPPASPR